jgi:hypothetical protein
VEAEERLTGGNLSVVVRVGDTVRREAGPWTEPVQALLLHLRGMGIQEVPAPLGFDAQGREILSFIPGQVGHDPLPENLRSDEILMAAAKLLRRLHAATTGSALLRLSGWQAPVREPVEVICHGDFAPYNCVFEHGTLVGVIDFDHAHPGPASWDIAYALYRFVPLMASGNPDGFGTLPDQIRRAKLFCDAYGLTDRAQISAILKARVAGMATFLREGAARRDDRLLANIAAGHLASYEADTLYLEKIEIELSRALTF